MLKQPEIAEAAKEFISNQLELKPEIIDAGKELKTLGLDSFRIIELVLFLERKTGLSFPDHAYTPQNLRSIDSIILCLSKLEK